MLTKDKKLTVEDIVVPFFAEIAKRPRRRLPWFKDFVEEFIGPTFYVSIKKKKMS